MQDARNWFKVVGERAISPTIWPTPLVAFFSQIASRMADAKLIPPKGVSHSPEGVDALAPLLLGLKDWALGKFDDADGLLKFYLAPRRRILLHGWPITSRLQKATPIRYNLPDGGGRCRGRGYAG